MRLRTSVGFVVASFLVAGVLEAQGGKRGGPPPRVAGAGVARPQAARPNVPKAAAGHAKGRPAKAAPPAHAGKPGGAGRPEPAGKPDTAGRPEHAGKPDHAGPPQHAGKPEHAGPPEHAGAPEGAGPPEHAGKPDGAGQPDDAGRPENPGRPDHAGPPEHAGQNAEGNGQGPKSIAEHLETKTQLRERLAERLPSGTSVEQAASGFENLGQFVAAVNVSHNLDLPFDQLKARVTGDGRIPLGQAIQELRPDVDAPAAAAQAEADARTLTGTSGGQ